MSPPTRHARARAAAATTALLLLSGCATMGSLMSPYPEKFDCKNSDHGQCIHPERAYEDAVAGTASRSDPAVTNNRRLLEELQQSGSRRIKRDQAAAPDAYAGYRDSVYAELKGLIEAPVTPMLKPARTVRTLILPYADRQRPDRLYMPRYVYSIVDKPVWVVGGALMGPPAQASTAPVASQVRQKRDDVGDAAPSVVAPVVDRAADAPSAQAPSDGEPRR